MKFYLLFLSILFIILFSQCNSEQSIDIPEDILKPDSMEVILRDLHIADATLMNTQPDNKEYKYRSDIYYAQILRKHNISRAEFDSSIMFYARYPLLFEKIYDKVLAEMNRMYGEMSDKDTIKMSSPLSNQVN